MVPLSHHGLFMCSRINDQNIVSNWCSTSILRIANQFIFYWININIGPCCMKKLQPQLGYLVLKLCEIYTTPETCPNWVKIFSQLWQLQSLSCLRVKRYLKRTFLITDNLISSPDLNWLRYNDMTVFKSHSTIKLTCRN